jgi:thioesterase domain-containing protein
VYGIHSPYDEELRRWQEHHQLDLTLEELAARNLAIMQRVQPHGPYCLAGFCFGGVLAFEVARQLQRQDERVALLVLLDAAYLPGLKPLAWPWLRRWAYNAWLACREGPAHVLTKVRERLEHEKSRGSDLNTRLTGLLTGRWGEEFASEMLKAYQGKPLWWARSYSFDLGATNGWSEVVLGGVQVEDIQCGHVNITEEPYVGEAAKKIAHHLFRNGGK